jgi:enoyl-CoA hydratase
LIEAAREALVEGGGDFEMTEVAGRAGVIEMARSISALPQPAIRTDKEAAVRGFGRDLDEGLLIEARTFNRSFHEPATQEGLRQFVERDHPDRRREYDARTPGLVRD